MSESRIAELERENADLRRQITELREAVRALLDDAPSQRPRHPDNAPFFPNVFNGTQ